MIKALLSLLLFIPLLSKSQGIYNWAWSGEQHYIVREVLINGKLVPYDAVSGDTSLENAKASYRFFDYIGDSQDYYINGVLNHDKHMEHYFIQKFGRDLDYKCPVILYPMLLNDTYNQSPVYQPFDTTKCN